MFEKYTEKARRVIFFGRYEASQFGSPYIETEHLLLGLLREDKSLSHRFLQGQAPVEDIRKQIEANTVVREKVSTSVDLPLSNENRRVLGYAAEEAERLSHRHIGTEHLLLGLLREEMSFAARILNEHGVRLSAVREELARTLQSAQPIEPKEFVLLSEFSVHMTRMARQERYLPLVGRDKEFEQMLHILGRSNKNNVVLVGEPGVGKRTIVEELVQRVADDAAAAFLRGKLFVSIDLSMVVTAAQHSGRSREFLSAVTAEMIKADSTLFFFDELHALLAAGPESGAHEITMLLKPALLSGKVRCIASATPAEHQAALKKAPWLSDRFLTVKVEPPTEDAAVKVLQIVKNRFEKFHSVQYTDEALFTAVVLSNRLVTNHCLPDKAIDVIDDAGAYVKMTQEKMALPEELVEAGKRLTFIARRHENAVENHEFEKARFYADEERIQREALIQLHRKHNIPEKQVVAREHIEEALARCTGLSIKAVREVSGNPEIETQKLKTSPKKSKKRKSS
ncbi:MAG TPA: Clp protease N-terminal domain-containing protein [Candidatus Dormibacteraeota bacterium]|jgi:ATP-dependent Clp protease ATP-binding subunit ClpC|nr:Clp protease N-terminal domain-containing protein [Candidatus Dormibacteraeota bacterium]